MIARLAATLAGTAGTRPRASRGLHAAWRIAAGVALLLAVVALNGRPAVFTDTDDYYALGKDLVHAAAALVVAPPLTPPPTAAHAAEIASDVHMSHTQMASRSFVYAIPLYLTEQLGTLWLVAVVQAGCVVWTALIAWRVVVGTTAGYLATVAILAAGTSLPFFAGFAMPDVFAGVAVLAVAVLIVSPERLRRHEKAGLAAVLAFALAVHASHILFVVPLALAGAVALAVFGVRRRIVARRIGVIVAALAVAVGVTAAYGVAVRLNTGDPLRSQPFLTARVLADGPGRRYLRHACASGERYALCAFANRPLDSSEDILWSDTAATAVFLPADYATRTAIEVEELRFVLNAIAFDPVGQVAASLRNWGLQLVTVAVDDPLRDPVYYLTDPYWRLTHLPIVIRRVADCGVAGAGCTPRLTTAATRLWHGTVIVAALAVAAAAAVGLARGGPLGRRERRLVAVVAMIAAGLVLNAAVCGMLSGPFARYQARIAWLIPFAACMMVAGGRRPDGGSTHVGEADRNSA